MLNWRIIVPLACVVLAQGCTTTLKVDRLDTMPKDGGGVPYHLMTTEFLLTVEPPSEKAPLTTYTVSQVTTPDPVHRYWVNIDPAWLTKTKFKLAFGSKGELTGTTGEATEQVTPTIKAIGEFAVAAIGAVAGVAGKVGSTVFITSDNDVYVPEKALLATLTGLKDINALPDCTKEKRAPNDAEKKIRTAMVERMQEAINLNSTRQFHKLFAYRSAVEKCWLIASDIYLKEKIVGRTALYETAKKDYESADIKNAKRRDLISKGLDTIIMESTKEDRESFSRIAEALVKDEPSNIRESLAALIAAAQLEFGNIALFRDQRKIISEIVKLDVGAWRDRHATYLEELIEQMERRLIEANKTPCLKEDKETPCLKEDKETLKMMADLTKYRAEHAFTIGAQAEFDRAQLLRDFLRVIPNRITRIDTHVHQGSAMGEYEIARKELEVVLTVIAQKRAALIPTTPAQPKRTNMVKAEVFWEEKKLSDDIVKDKVRERSMEQETEEPEFVVVVERGYNR